MPVSIYLHRDSVDFRKSINGLVAIVEQEMQLSPFAPALFVFCNKNRDRIKMYCTGIGAGFACGTNAWRRRSSSGRAAIIQPQ